MTSRAAGIVSFYIAVGIGLGISTGRPLGVATAAIMPCVCLVPGTRRGVFENALAPIKEASFRAIAYVVADRIGGCNEWDRHVGDALQPLMSAGELKAWIYAGQEIGSHTNTHPNLTRISLAEAREEIIASKKKLEDLFGLAVNHFCYPYGAYDEAIRGLVEEAGFSSACTTSPGVNRLPVNRFELKRLTARYASRNLKSYWNRIREAVASFR